MKLNEWVVLYLPSCTFSRVYGTYAAARGEAQAECQTDKSPKRIGVGFYSLYANGHDVQFGTVEAFKKRGYVVTGGKR